MSDVEPRLKAAKLDELGPVVEGPQARHRPEPQSFEGRYCRLEPLSEHHADDLWAQMAVADPEMRQWMFLAGLGSFEDQAAYIAAWQQFSEAVDNLTYVVIPTDPASGLPAVATGQFSFPRLRPAAGSVEVGFVRFPPQMARTRFQPRPSSAMAHVFDDLRYRRYEWKCNADNQPSMHRRASWLHLRRHLPPGHDQPRPQPRYGAVVDHRQRMAGAEAGLSGLARPSNSTPRASSTGALPI